MSNRRGLQVGPRIDWSNTALTRGLRNVIVPSLTGAYQGARCLVDPRCQMVDIQGVVSGDVTGQIPDRAFYSNYFSPQRWNLVGPSAVLSYTRDFSLLVRTYQLLTTGTIIKSTNAVSENFDFQLYTPTAAYALTGNYPAGQVNAFTITNRSCQNNWITFVWVWDSNKLQWTIINEDGQVSVVKVSDTYFVWLGPLGGGAGYGGYDWEFGPAGTHFISHCYLWESALSARAASYLALNPGAIFERSNSLIQAPQPPRNLVLPGGLGGYAYTGYPATLKPGRGMMATLGSYLLAGLPVVTRASLILRIGPGGYAYTGKAVGLALGRYLQANPGGYILAGEAATLTLKRGLLAEYGIYTLEGMEAGLLFRVMHAGGGRIFYVRREDRTLIVTRDKDVEG